MISASGLRAHLKAFFHGEGDELKLTTIWRTYELVQMTDSAHLASAPDSTHRNWDDGV